MLTTPTSSVFLEVLLRAWPRLRRALALPVGRGGRGARVIALALVGAALVSSAVGQDFRFSTVAGDGEPGFADVFPGRFGSPKGVTVDGSGIVYVADSGNGRVRKINLSSGSAVLSTVATGLNGVSGVAVATAGPNAGVIFVADTLNHVIKKIALDGTVSVVAGLEGEPGPSVPGLIPLASARFNRPEGIVTDATGSVLYVADTGNHVIRMIAPTDTLLRTGVSQGYALGSVSTVAGVQGGAGADALLEPRGLVKTTGGQGLYVADSGNHAVRYVDLVTIPSSLAPRIIAQPVATYRNSVEPFSFSVAVACGVPVSYRWQIKLNGQSEFTDLNNESYPSWGGYVAGVLTSTLSLYRYFVLDEDVTHWVRVKVTSANGTTYSSDTSLSVSSQIGLSGYPSFRTGPDGGALTRPGVGSVVFSASGPGSGANGFTGRTLQWEMCPAGSTGFVDCVNGADFSGSTTEQLTISPKGSLSGAIFRLRASSRDEYNYLRSSYSGGALLLVPEGGNFAPQTRSFTTFAGLPGTAGSDDGPQLAARFNSPSQLALDGDASKLYVAEPGNHTIRLIELAGDRVTTIAGLAGSAGATNGVATEARFTAPWGVALSAAGKLMVADSGNNLIRQGEPYSPPVEPPTPPVVVPPYPVFAAQPADATINPGLPVRFSATVTAPSAPALQWQRRAGGAGDFVNLTEAAPYTGTATSTLAIAVATSVMSGDQFRLVATNASSAVTSTYVTLRVDPGVPLFTRLPQSTAVASGQNAVFTAALNSAAAATLRWQRQPEGATGFTDLNEGGAYAGTTGLTLTVNNVTAAMAGDRFRVVARSAANAALASTSAFAVLDVGTSDFGRAYDFFTRAGDGVAGYTNTSPGRFAEPKGLTVEADGTIYLADSRNSRIRKLTRSGLLSTLGGSGSFALAGAPAGVAVDGAGNLYVADTVRNQIKKIAADGTVSLLAGPDDGSAGLSAEGAVGLDQARFNGPQALVLNSAGTVLYVADTGNHVIRKIDLLHPGFGDGVGTVWTIAGTPGVAGTSSAHLNTPQGLLLDGRTLYVADSGNHAVRVITLPSAQPSPLPEFVVQPADIIKKVEWTTNSSVSLISEARSIGVAVKSAGAVSYNWQYRLGEGQVWRDVAQQGEDGLIGAYEQGLIMELSYGNTLRLQLVGSDLAQNGMQFRVQATNAFGSTTSEPATLKLYLPRAGDGPTTPGGSDSTLSKTFADLEPYFSGKWGQDIPTPGGYGKELTVVVTGDGTSFPPIFYNNEPYGWFSTTSIARAVVASGYGQSGQTGVFRIARIAFVTNPSFSIRGVSTMTGPIAARVPNDAVPVGLPVFFSPGPADALKSVGASATFSAYVSGANTLVWQRRAAGSNAWFNLTNSGAYSGVTSQYLAVSGVTGAYLAVSGVTGAMCGDQFRVVATNANGSTTGGAATLRVSGFIYIQRYAVGSFAGTVGQSGSSDGTGTAALFRYPRGLALDAVGNLLVSDSGNHTLRRLRLSDRLVRTVGGYPGISGALGGLGTDARFNQPWGVAFDAAGNLYVGDSLNHTIRQGTLVASRAPQFVRQPENAAVSDGLGAAFSADISGSPAPTLQWQRRAGGTGDFVNLPADPPADSSASATFTGTRTTALAIRTALNAMSGDQFRLLATSSMGTAVTNVVTLVVNGGIPTFAQMPVSTTVTAGGTARFTAAVNLAPPGTLRWQRSPSGSSVFYDLGEGVPYSGTTTGTLTISGVTDAMAGDRFRLVASPTGDPSVFSISGVATLAVTPLLVPPLAAGYVYSTYAPGLEIQTNGVAVDSRGWLYVAATADHAIRVFQPNGVAFILAGSPGNSGTADGTGDAARFNSPQGVAVDAAFNVYVADSGNHSIRKITPGGDVTTVAGLSGTSGPSVPETGLTTARFKSPVGLAVDAAGLTIFVADSGNHVVRAIDLTYRAEAQIVTTLAGLDAQKGFADTQLYTPTNVVPFGNKLYVSDLTGAILRIDLDVWSSALDLRSTLDTRRSYPLVTVAGLRGNPPTGPMPFNQYRNVDGTGSEARFGVRLGLAVDAFGVVFVADATNNTIRRMTSDGVVTTVGGLPAPQGIAPAGTVDGSGGSERFTDPLAIAVGPDGKLFIGTSTTNAADRRLRLGAPAALRFPTLMAGRVFDLSSPSAVTFVPAVTNTLTTSALTYQWQWATASNPLGFAALTNGSADGLTVSGATTATLSVTSASLVHDGDLFRLFVANAAGLSAYSNTAPLAVRESPVFTSAPAATFAAGLFGSYTISTRATPALSSLTVTSGTLPSWATLTQVAGTNTATVSGTPSSVAGSPLTFTLTASNGSATADQAFSLTVDTGSAPTIVTAPVNLTVVAGQPATFTVVVTGSPPPALQWQRQVGGTGDFFTLTEGALYSGTTSSALTVSAVTAAMAGDRFRLVASNGSGPAATSAAAQLWVTGLKPVFAQMPQTTALIAGQPATFTAVVNSQPAATFQWQRQAGGFGVFSNLTDGAPYGGTTTSTLTITPASGGMNGDRFRLVATNAAGSTTSDEVALDAALAAGLLAPSIRFNPSNASAAFGLSASFAAGANGIPAPTLQWQRQPAGTTGFVALTDNATYSGTTTGTLVVSGITAPMALDQFRLVATNPVGTAISSPATLNPLAGIEAYAPTILLNPGSTVVAVGATATFSGAATGSPTPTLQWQVQVGGAGSWSNVSEVAPYSGTTTGMLSVAGVTAGMAGDRFQLVATNTAGTATSGVASLNGVGSGGTPPPGSGVATYAPTILLNPGSTTVAVGATATFSGAATGSPTPTLQWQVQVGGTGSWSNVSEVAPYSGTTTGMLTVAGVTAGMAGDRFQLVATNTAGTATSGVASLNGVGSGGTPLPGSGVAAYAPTILLNPGSTTVAVGATAMFSSGATGSPTPTLQWQVQLGGAGNWSNLSEGSPYSGTATGTLTVTSVTPWMAGDQFRLLALNSAGTATSGTASLNSTGSGATPNPGAGVAGFAPTLLLNPGSTMVPVGQMAAFSAAAIGAPTPTLQWQRQAVGTASFVNLAEGSTYSGTTTGTLVVSGVTAAMAGDQFRLVAMNALGTVTSGAASLNGSGSGSMTNSGTGVAGFAPTILLNPGSTLVSAGQTATFSAAATGAPTPTLQWQRQAVGTASFVNLAEGSTYSGTTTGTLVVTGVTAAMAGDQFRLVAMNASGTVTSGAASLNGSGSGSMTNSGTGVAGFAPTILLNPGSTLVSAGQTATFSAAATGAPTPTLQWQRQAVGTVGFVNLSETATYSGTNTVTLAVVAVTAAMAGDQFRLSASNSVGTVTSGAASLMLNGAP